MSDVLGDYLNSISRIPLLTSDEELHLGRMVRRWQDDAKPAPSVIRTAKKALDRIVSANLRLVVSYVKRYRRRIAHLNIELIDLIQAGNIGLIRAAEKFDPSRGYRFSTYAYWWIRHSVSRHVQELHASVRIPVALTCLVARIEKLTDSIGGIPPVKELAERLDESPRCIEMALALRQLSHVISLDQNLGSSECIDLTLLDTVSDGSVPEPDEDYAWLHDQLHYLSTAEFLVLQERYTADCCPSLRQVAERVGKSKFQVQAIERRALKKLRTALTPMLHPSGKVEMDQRPA
jgi:RNA polymerase primary sigma factor